MAILRAETLSCMPEFTIVHKKGRPCNVCIHSKRIEIENRMLAGERARGIAELYAGIEWRSIERHMMHHVSQAIKDTAALVNTDTMAALEINEENAIRGRSILDNLWDTHELLAKGMNYASENKKLISLAQIGAQRIRVLETLARMYMSLQAKPGDSNDTREQDWLTFQNLVTKSLEAYPEARAALGEAILATVEKQHEQAVREESDEYDASDSNGE